LSETATEADLVAVGLVRDSQPQLPRQRPYFRLLERTDGKHRVRELILRQREQEIGLILRRIDAALEDVAAGGLVALDPRVVSSRDEPRPKALGARRQGRELQVAVAVHAGDRRPACRVLADEVRHDRLAELPLEVDDVVGNSDLRRDPARVVEIVDRAARPEAHLAIRVRPRMVVQLHREADDLVSLARQQRGSDRGIDSAGHGYDYAHL
jgi:hypothetical protein